MRVEVLYFEGCPSHEQLAPRLEELVREAGITDAVRLRRVESEEEAQAERFLGSPTVRVEGRDVEPGADERDDFGLKCRLYRVGGRASGVPPEEWIRAALTRPQESDGRQAAGGSIDLGELAATIQAARPRFDLEEQAAALALYRLLAEGSPVDARALAARARVEPARAAQLLDDWPEVVRDDRGRVVAFGGLSLTGTAHRFEVSGRLLYTWCAWDTLFLPELLGRSAQVTSECPATGASVELTVAPTEVERVAPAEAVLSMRAPAAGDDLIARFCRQVHFFTSRRAAEGWLARRDDGFVLTIEEGFELGRIGNRANFPDALR